MITGHLEYDTTTLAEEYDRDLKKGIDIEPPENYFPNNDTTREPIKTWRSHSHLLIFKLAKLLRVSRNTI